MKESLQIGAYRGDFVGEDRIVALGKAGRIHEFDLADGRELKRVEGMKYGTSIRVSPDGRLIAVTTSEGKLAVFSREGELQYRRKIDSEISQGVAWSPDSTKFAMAHHRSHLALHDAATGEEMNQVPAGWVGRVRSIDTRLLLIDRVLGDDMMPRFQFFNWDLNRLGDPLILPPCPNDVCCNASFSKLAATYNQEIRVFDAAGSLLASFPSPKGQVISSIALHPNGHEIGVVKTGGDFFRVDAATGEIIFQTRYDFGVSCDYSPGGKRLIVYGMKGSLVMSL